MPAEFAEMSPIPGTQTSPGALMGQQPQGDPNQGMEPMGQQNLQAQAALFQELQTMHAGVITGKEVLVSIAQQFPATAEPVRNILVALDAVAQGLPTLVTAMTSQAPEPYAPSPMVMSTDKSIPPPCVRSDQRN